MKLPYEWDIYSDQPYKIMDRDYKRRKQVRAWPSLLKTGLISLVILPASYLFRYLVQRHEIDSQHFFGISVNVDRDEALEVEMIQELGIKSILIRMPLWEMERLDHYAEFCSRFEGCEITINILQDREHIENLDLARSDLCRIFETLGAYSSRFQIGSAVNRTKWGFFSMGEYVDFYAIAYWLKVQKFNTIELIGPGIIDFEYHYTAHALFNDHRLYFDSLSSLLYVDRRGAPENTQMGFSLQDKIKLQRAMMLLSRNVGSNFYITETNWPISDTAPYAPTSEYECVDEETYAAYMLRYYLLAFATQHVNVVFWHQLIAPGYGLVDNREGIRKRKAYDVFKTMLAHLQDATFVTYSVVDKRDKGYTSYGEFETRHKLTCKNRHGEVIIMWSQQEHYVRLPKPCLVVSYDGTAEESERANIGEKPVYIYPEGRP